MEKKDLHLAKNLDGLQRFYYVNPFITQEPIHAILLQLRSFAEEGGREMVAGDEEQSFVQYMKFMNLLSKLQKTPRYKIIERLITKFIGGNRSINRIFDRMELLKASLQQRYKDEYSTPYSSSYSKPLAESTRLNFDLDSTSFDCSF